MAASSGTVRTNLLSRLQFAIISFSLAPIFFRLLLIDMKLDNWYHRRFIGDRKADGASTGKQRLLDFPRAKWQTFAAMEPYYRTHVQALIDNGICKKNLRSALSCTSQTSHSISQSPTFAEFDCSYIAVCVQGMMNLMLMRMVCRKSPSHFGFLAKNGVYVSSRSTLALVCIIMSSCYLCFCSDRFVTHPRASRLYRLTSLALMINLMVMEVIVLVGQNGSPSVDSGTMERRSDRNAHHVQQR